MSVSQEKQSTHSTDDSRLSSGLDHLIDPEANKRPNDNEPGQDQSPRNVHGAKVSSVQSLRYIASLLTRVIYSGSLLFALFSPPYSSTLLTTL
jgi:hypothetical protein